MIDTDALKIECNYHEDGAEGLAEIGGNAEDYDDSVDALIAYKDALEIALNKRPTLATIAFQPEAGDTAAEFFALCTQKGYIVDAVPVHGEAFSAVPRGLNVGEDGQWKLLLHEWDDEAGAANPDRARVLDIYDELERIEII